MQFQNHKYVPTLLLNFSSCLFQETEGDSLNFTAPVSALGILYKVRQGPTSLFRALHRHRKQIETMSAILPDWSPSWLAGHETVRRPWGNHPVLASEAAPWGPNQPMDNTRDTTQLIHGNFQAASESLESFDKKKGHCGRSCANITTLVAMRLKC